MKYCTTVSYKVSAAIREALKAAFPEFRFSVYKAGDNSAVHVRIMSGPEDLGSLTEFCRSMIAYDVAQVDFDYIEEHRNLTSWLIRPTRADFEKYQDLLNAIIEVIQKSYRANMSDSVKNLYHDHLIKYSLGLGKYEKPYEIRYPHKGIYCAPASYTERARTTLAFRELAA